jgi:3-deoxy-manno-octulosonate cytidylyltransferase (CMP-KDO synthetase)
MMKVLGVIPSRFASTRFPGKPLVDIMGKSMIQRVYDQVSLAESLDDIIVATDDQRIFDHVQDFGGMVMMTSSNHHTGTDRCNEVSEKLSGFDLVINIQGDEPIIDAAQIDLVIKCFKNPKCQIATLVKPIDKIDLLHDLSKIKAVLDTNGKALYFSRQAIPFQKMDPLNWLSGHQYWQHIGIYAYRTDVLKSIAKLEPSSLELAESLEQLRWLENGFEIYTSVTQHDSISVDIPEDLTRVEQIIRSSKS